MFTDFMREIVEFHRGTDATQALLSDDMTAEIDPPYDDPAFAEIRRILSLLEARPPVRRSDRNCEVIQTQLQQYVEKARMRRGTLNSRLAVEVEEALVSIAHRLRPE